jgi:Recombination endonuclease VII
MTKRCTKCGVEKPFDDFHRKDGGRRYYAWCKVCMNAYARAYQRGRRKQDPEGERARHRAWYRANREHILARHREQAREQRERETPEQREARLVKTKAGFVKYRYGIELAEYQAILARGCAVCGATENLHLDHDHANGQVRDALCNGCNVGIGMLGEDPSRLRAAADYIEHHGGRRHTAG